MMPCSLLSEHIEPALKDDDHVLLALSGGVDSVVLLHLLVALRKKRPAFGVRAIYINHGLSTNATLWGEHCQMLCDMWQVPFEQAQVQVDADSSGIESGARVARYRVFEQCLQPNEVLLTAQHLDDQCETFMLALKRGSGPTGLSSMAFNQPFAQGRQIRPLLNVSRRQIEEYARYYALKWVDDESNADDRFDRNFLRLRVLPIIQQRWSAFPQAVARSAELCAEQEQLLNELLADELNALIGDEGSLAITPLTVMSEVKRQALLRRWLAQLAHSMPSRQQLQRLWQEVALARDDASPQLQLGDKSVRRFKQRLYLLDKMQTVSGITLAWDGDLPLALPDGLGVLTVTDCASEVASVIRAPGHDEKVTIHFGAQSEIRIVGRAGSRSVKKLWQEFNIPPWQRERIPLIYFNDRLMAAVGVFVTQEAMPENEKKVWTVVWRSDKSPENLNQC